MRRSARHPKWRGRRRWRQCEARGRQLDVQVSSEPAWRLCHAWSARGDLAVEDRRQADAHSGHPTHRCTRQTRCPHWLGFAHICSATPAPLRRPLQHKIQTCGELNWKEKSSFSSSSFSDILKKIFDSFHRLQTITSSRVVEDNGD